MDSNQPRYPALHVHCDGSFGVLVSQEYWSEDVDQWFWSDAGDYLIDSEAVRFDQHCVRDRGRPLDVPQWRYISQLSEDEVYSLAAAAPAPKICLEDLARVNSARGRIAFLIEQELIAERFREMNHSKRTCLEKFQKATGALSLVAFLALIGAGLLEPDDRNPWVAGFLILTILLFTAWMIAGSINQRRRLIALAKILSALPDATDEPKPESARDDNLNQSQGNS